MDDWHSGVNFYIGQKNGFAERPTNISKTAKFGYKT